MSQGNAEMLKFMKDKYGIDIKTPDFDGVKL